MYKIKRRSVFLSLISLFLWGSMYAVDETYRSNFDTQFERRFDRIEEEDELDELDIMEREIFGGVLGEEDAHNEVVDQEIQNQQACDELYAAIVEGDANLVQRLIERYRGTIPNYIRGGIDSSTTPLHDACYYLNPEIVQIFVANGANIFEPDVFGNTALHYLVLSEDAGEEDFDSVLCYLLNNGANINATNDDGETPLMVAIARRDVQKVEALLRHNPLHTLQEDDRWMIEANTPFHIIARNKVVPGLGELILQMPESNIDDLNAAGETPLNIAINNGDSVMVDWFLLHGAKAQGIQETPSPLAIALDIPWNEEFDSEKERIIRHLIREGVDPNMPMRVSLPSGRFLLELPLCFIINKGAREDLFRLLLEEGADPRKTCSMRDPDTKKNKAVSAAAYARVTFPKGDNRTILLADQVKALNEARNRQKVKDATARYRGE